MDELFVIANRKKYEVFIVTLCIILFLTRASIPFFKYPFLVLFGAICIYILVLYRSRILSGIKSLISIYPLVLLLLIYLLIACILSDKIYLIIVKDIVNIIILLSLMVIMKIFIQDSHDIKLYYNSFLHLFIIFALVISLQRFYDFFYVASFPDYYYENYLHLKKEVVDRNFALIPVFFGMTGILSIFYHKILKSKLLIYSILLLIFSVSFLLSGSRRGVLLFFLIIFILFTLQVWRLFCNSLILKQICRNSRYYFYSFFVSLILLIIIVFNTSVYFKNSVLASIGVQDVSYTKHLISETIFRYVHFLNKDIDGNSIYSNVWHPVFDPRDPEAWTGKGNYKIAKNLSGKNVNIVPAGSKGYLLDSTCLGDASPHHSYYFLSIKEDSVNIGDSLIVSVYCYVSEDFDGNAVALRTNGSFTASPDKYYDLKNKGCWQKLIVPLSCLKGNITVYLYMNKAGVKDFSHLKGYVIFAYPEIHRLSISGTSSNSSKLINYDNKVHINSNKVYNLNRVIEDTLKIQKNIGKAGFSNFNLSFLVAQIESVNNTDPIRNWITKIVSEDTTYHGYKANLIFKKPKDNFGEDRTTLWKFALEIFNKEFNWHQKIFGGGFNFLNWYGYCFSGNKTETEYPHNPFLHILLYSGILGLSIYLIFMYKVLYYYIKYSKEYPVFFIFFLITFYFTFFSGGNPFDPPLMGFFVMLPFFIHYIHEKDNSVLIKKII